MKVEHLYVVDTNALIWYLSKHRKLSQTARDIFAAAERGETRIVVSSVVLAELYYANKKYGLFGDFGALYRRLQAAPQYRLASFHADHVLDFDGNFDIPEMHDRIIAGLARRLGAPLITSDPEITDAVTATVIW
jgi:predicted nucleic acid-binding protein